MCVCVKLNFFSASFLVVFYKATKNFGKIREKVSSAHNNFTQFAYDIDVRQKQQNNMR
jgi:hypothetical protein